MEIGSHSRTHWTLVSLGDDHRREEIAGSAADIAALGLPRPRFFAHPYGELDDTTKEAVRDAGFVAAFGIEDQWIDPESDRFNLPRLIIHASDRGWRFHFRTAAPALYEQLDVAPAG